MLTESKGCKRSIERLVRSQLLTKRENAFSSELLIDPSLGKRLGPLVDSHEREKVDIPS